MRISQKADYHKANHIIVGMPFLPNGSIGKQAELVKNFCRELEAESGLPITTWDERYSTIEAERLLRQAGRQPTRDKGRLDAAAATIILQSYLDTERNR